MGNHRSRSESRPREIVWSIPSVLKEGEQEVYPASQLRSNAMALPLIVMAFDETVGQADTYQRRIEICRSVPIDVLVDKVGKFAPQDIIFDPNIFPCCNGDGRAPKKCR